jgi:signal transduction histidine kinase
MASQPADQDPVTGRIDKAGRLIAADAALEALQVEAGSRVGAELALPQIAAIAQLASRLGVAVSRPATVGRANADVELWVRATPAGDEVLLSLERWVSKPADPPRLAGLVLHEREVEIGAAPDEWAADEELRMVSVSARLAERLGLQSSEVIGQPLTRLFKLEEDADGSMPLIAAVASRTDFEGQKARLRGGEDVALELRGVAVRSAEGAFAGYRGEALPESPPAALPGAAAIAADIDAALDEALRSPLDRIIESADRIVQQAEGPLRSDYADYASDIAAAARHLLSVVRSMSGEDDQSDRIDLVALAQEAAGLLAAAAKKKGVTIDLDRPEPHLCHGDARGVVQILVNLLGNAVRHSPKGASVSVSFDADESAVRVHVADQGPGIDPADQQRIFQRFEQAGTAEEGTGLGLAIARRLARAMGGDITVDSVPGQGARFSLHLPPL